ncbi:MAG: hypothetical protein LUE90_02165 [Clostridiales bacterium]|nr:hypothetical protein [Clostridiales bacterium]
MSYRIAICDDSAVDRAYIRSLINLWAKGEAFSVRVEEFPSAESFLFCYEADKQ